MNNENERKEIKIIIEDVFDYCYKKYKKPLTDEDKELIASLCNLIELVWDAQDRGEDSFNSSML